MSKPILEFQKEFRWLSNFTPCKIHLHGRTFNSVEHAYMSAKSDDENWKDFCASNASPGQVKRKSRNIKLINHWDSIKVPVMAECIRQKFSQEPFRSKLISTGSAHIQEGNHWNDKFWGVCLKTGNGKNTLGNLIMEFRLILQEANYEQFHPHLGLPIPNEK